MINFQKLKSEYEEISAQLASPDVINDRVAYTRLSKRFSYLEKIIELLTVREQYSQEKEHLSQVLSHPNEDQEVKALARQELAELEEKITLLNEEIEDKIFEASEPEHDLIIEIRAAAGGEESALFATTLFKMYSKYIEKNGWKLEMLSSNQTEIGGLKEVTFAVKGKGAFLHLQFESGVHRVQRVPVTESGGRIHTSTVTVAVLVEPKDVELNINPADLKIDTYRASGAGGQHVNVTDSAVRITHLPTGVVVSCQDERSQLKNKIRAMRVLKARIMEKKRLQDADKVTQERRGQIGSGDRSEKIRTYNFPERRVTDHRINFTIYRLEEVLEGNPDEVIKMLIKAQREKVYETKGLA